VCLCVCVCVCVGLCVFVFVCVSNFRRPLSGAAPRLVLQRLVDRGTTLAVDLAAVDGHTASDLHGTVRFASRDQMLEKSQFPIRKWPNISTAKKCEGVKIAKSYRP